MPPKATPEKKQQGKKPAAKKPVKDPLSGHLYAVPKNPTIIYQGRRTIYNRPGDEALYAAVTTYLDKVENVQLTHWSNTLSTEQTKSTEYTTGTTVTTGQETSVEVGLEAAFKGIGISFGASTTILSSEETTSSKTETITVNVPAKSDTWVYQRKYVFRTEMNFVLDAWGELWNVGSNGAYFIQKATVMSETFADDYVTSAKPLKGHIQVEFTGLKPENLLASTTRKYENTTGLCKETLQRLGIDGSQQG